MRSRHVLLLTCAALSVASWPIPAAAAAPAKTPAKAQAARDAGDAGMSSVQLRARLSQLIARMDIPYQSFTLPNGLKVLVHTDKSAPRVNVSVWYNVGSKYEPAGRSGFAHLFEHLMFNGSENIPGDYMKPLSEVGGNVNGSTTADRTNYFETIPVQALDRALFMESDRMGHLLGALTQDTLDEQRGVVQNEKRRGDDSPTSIMSYMARDAIYPAGHPYGHAVIGSMKDLNAADLDDVRGWFKEHYGPNNAMLILAGDVDLATAQQLVIRYFGDIPAGPRNVRPVAKPVVLQKTISESATAPVTTAKVMRMWSVPGADSMDSYALDAIGGMTQANDDNALERRLTRGLKLFTSVSVNYRPMAQGGEFNIAGSVRPGVDVKVATAALDAEVARFLNSTPTQETLDRYVATSTYDFARGLEDPTSRGFTLGEAAMLQGSPDAYKVELNARMALTPQSLMRVAREWLNRPRYELTLLPGPRMTPKDDGGIDGSTAAAANPAAANPAVNAAPASAPAAAFRTGSRGTLPAVGPAPDPTFPAVRHAVLRNGLPVNYLQETSSTFTSLFLRIKGGKIHEPIAEAGTMAAMYGLMYQGFAGHSEDWINDRSGLLGVNLYSGAAAEEADIGMDAPETNLPAALQLFREMLTQPDFVQSGIDRYKRERIDRLKTSRLDQGTLLTEALSPLVDAGSPYNRLNMYGNVAKIERINRSRLLAAYHRWVRPEQASLQVVSALPLEKLMPLLEQALGNWTAQGSAPPLPAMDYKPAPAPAQIVLIDLPGAVQATVVGTQMIGIDDRAPRETLDLANTILGGNFTSRLNMNLREGKHWTYGVSGYPQRHRYGSTYEFNGTIQQDRVGDAIGEVMREIRDITGPRPITRTEFDDATRAIAGQIASGMFGRQVKLAALNDVVKYGRPDDYPGKVAARLRAVTLDGANAILRDQLSADRWIWGIVGNAAIIRPQLDKLGLPVKVVKAEDVLPPL